MAIDGQKRSAADDLRKTRSFGKVRCHNPSCMGRIQPDAGQQQVECPTCGMQYRLFWVNPQLPRIRGPVWDVNRKIAQSTFAKKQERAVKEQPASVSGETDAGASPAKGGS